MTIGERIKELRAEANLRQSELGKAIGFSGQVTLSRQQNLLIAVLHASVCQQITFLAGLLQDMLLRIRKKFPQCKQEQKPVWLSCR